jgi:hypothetical protein
LNEFLKGEGFPSGKRSEIVELFRKSTSGAIEAFLAYRQDVRRWKAQKARDRATRYFLFNALYLSDGVTEAAERVLLALQGVIVDAQLGQNEATAQALLAMQDIHSDLKGVRMTMQTELAAGYYSSSAQTAPDT